MWCDSVLHAFRYREHGDEVRHRKGLARRWSGRACGGHSTRSPEAPEAEVIDLVGDPRDAAYVSRRSVPACDRRARAGGRRPIPYRFVVRFSSVAETFHATADTSDRFDHTTRHEAIARVTSRFARLP